MASGILLAHCCLSSRYTAVAITNRNNIFRPRTYERITDVRPQEPDNIMHNARSVFPPCFISQTGTFSECRGEKRQRLGENMSPYFPVRLAYVTAD